MKQLLLAFLLFAGYSGMSQGFSFQQNGELPKEVFLKIDTTFGVVKYYSKRLKNVTEGCMKLDSLFRVAYWKFPNYSSYLAYIPPTIEYKTDTILFKIKVSLWSIDLSKNFEFIPLSKMQD